MYADVMVICSNDNCPLYEVSRDNVVIEQKGDLQLETPACKQCGRDYEYDFEELLSLFLEPHEVKAAIARARWADRPALPGREGPDWHGRLV